MSYILRMRLFSHVVGSVTMSTVTHPTPETIEAIEQIVDRARSLYSLPAVAVEVIQLTSNPKVDAWTLKECIQTDPALTAKILRVVNSSLFGLSREVSDLNQALALLGTKPLKLLVLGFSLPENLFAEVAREQLDWYWSRTLARAVAAREISEQLFELPGDDAFLAGLLQDIGILVLLGQFKKPYADFLGRVIEERIELERVEIESLGFDHVTLTAALLQHWNMPRSLVGAISEPRDIRMLAHNKASHAQLAQILHLAELLAELLGQNRLSVLPDLLEACREYRGIEKARLNELVALVQPKVQQLAEVLSLDLPEGTDYLQVLTEAHAQMSELAEMFAEPFSRIANSEEHAYEDVVADTAHLRTAVDGFLHSSLPLKEEPSSDGARVVPIGREASIDGNEIVAMPLTDILGLDNDFAQLLTLAVGQSRSRRQPLSVILLEVSGTGGESEHYRHLFSQVLDSACQGVDVREVLVKPVSTTRRALMLTNCERRDAVRLADQAMERAEQLALQLADKGTMQKVDVSAGVASVALPPKNFPPQDLLEKAQRCLVAAQSASSGTVKSLEIY